MAKTDMQLKQDIEEELRWDPKVNAAQVGVTVNEGAVSLLGTVDTFAQKWAAEDATKRVGGVHTVVQGLAVKLSEDHRRADSEIAAAVESTLKWNVSIPKSVSSKVQQGQVTLEGKVGWDYERAAAEQAVRHLTGVIAVHNYIALQPGASANQVREQVQAGHVSSWQSIEDAAHAAWAAPGVTEVVDLVKRSMTF